MAETKWTEGPWFIYTKYGSYAGDNICIYAPDDDNDPWHVATAEAECGGENEACQTPANAHLIAAAPTLYRELERLDPGNPALAKARGEAQ